MFSMAARELLHRRAPLLGEHTREVLAEIGYGEEEITAIIAESRRGT